LEFLAKLFLILLEQILDRVWANWPM